MVIGCLQGTYTGIQYAAHLFIGHLIIVAQQEYLFLSCRKRIDGMVQTIFRFFGVQIGACGTDAIPAPGALTVACSVVPESSVPHLWRCDRSGKETSFFAKVVQFRQTFTNTFW